MSNFLAQISLRGVYCITFMTLPLSHSPLLLFSSCSGEALPMGRWLSGGLGWKEMPKDVFRVEGINVSILKYFTQKKLTNIANMPTAEIW